MSRRNRVASEEAFAGQRALQRLEFENESRLGQIRRSPFAFYSSLHSSLETIDATAFRESKISAIQIAEGNQHFRVSGSFLLTFDGTSLILYFGEDSTVRIRLEIHL
jgi:hypothetical protein